MTLGALGRVVVGFLCVFGGVRGVVSVGVVFSVEVCVRCGGWILWVRCFQCFLGGGVRRGWWCCVWGGVCVGGWGVGVGVGWVCKRERH